MPSAREIKSRLDKRDAEARRKRAEAVLAVGVAGGAAVRARERYEAALRVKFEAALRTREDADRAAELRAAFEAALIDTAEVSEADIAAGHAVVDASTLRVSQAELAEVTELRTEDLRRWAQLARQEAHETTEKDSGREAPGDVAARLETGFAVVAAPELRLAERADPEGSVGSDVIADEDRTV